MTITVNITHENYAAKMQELVEIEAKIIDMYLSGEAMTAQQMDYYNQLRNGILAYRSEHAKSVF